MHRSMNHEGLQGEEEGLMVDQCFACTKPKELTLEHIIPQAGGGKLKAYLYKSGNLRVEVGLIREWRGHPALFKSLVWFAPD